MGLGDKNPDRRVTSHESDEGDEFSNTSSYDSEYGSSSSGEYLSGSDSSKFSDDLGAKSVKTIKTVKTNKTGKSVKSRKQRKPKGGPGHKAKKTLQHQPSHGPNVGVVGINRNRAATELDQSVKMDDDSFGSESVSRGTSSKR